MPTVIHPTALVEPGAQLGADCEIHPYAIVKRWAILGDRVIVHPFAVVGGDPQDLKFDGASASYVRIGTNTRIREHVTVNRGTDAGSVTVIGENCLLMASCHVAHDCVIGREVIIANAVLIAGHVHIGDHTIVGGGAGIHQFVRIGEGTMMAGGARCTLDVPPYSLAAERDELIGLNVVGLRRRGFSREAIRELKEAIRTLYGTPGNIREVAARPGGQRQFCHGRGEAVSGILFREQARLRPAASGWRGRL